MIIFDRFALKTKTDIPYFEIPEMTKLGWVGHGFLTRKGGVSLPPFDALNLSNNNGDRDEHVFENKNRIAKAFSFDLNRLVLLHQIHQDRILLLKKPFSTLPSPLEYDAVITNASNLFVGILTADCVPIFVVDRKKRAIAAIHAGRQGTAFRITAKVLKRMEEEFACSPDNLLIALGPSIGFCCYEIDKRVFLPEWEPYAMSVDDGKWMIDLARINIAQVKEEGIKEEQIFWVDLCTSCHEDLFFSNRKEGITGRQLSFIGIV